MNIELLKLFNKQINQEFYTSYLYYAMSTYFDKIMMKSFSMYMKHLSSIELKLAQQMHDYLILRDEKLEFLKIDEPILNWIDATDIFSKGFVQERILLGEFKNLYSFAKNCNDIGVVEFIVKIVNQKTKSLEKWKNMIISLKKDKTASLNFKDNFCKI